MALYKIVLKGMRTIAAKPFVKEKRTFSHIRMQGMKRFRAFLLVSKDLDTGIAASSLVLSPFSVKPTPAKCLFYPVCQTGKA